MNVGIFGNTNNYAFLLADGFRSLGVGVKLVVNRAASLHRPESVDASLAGRYPDWILDAAQVAEDDFVALSPRIAEALNFVSSGTDACVLNDLGPSLHALVERPAMALLTGSDLTYFADFGSAAARAAGWGADFRRSPGGRLHERRWLEMVARQREGILAARAVSFGLPGLVPEGDALLAAIGVPDARRAFVYMADTTRIAQSRAPARETLRILNGARLNWVQPMPPGFSAQDAKGTDVLLQGVQRFLRAGGRAELRLVAKGLHVDATRALVERLGIADTVTWLPEMSLGAFREEMAAADVVCDQLSTSFPGMTALDAMALGRPVLANFRLDVLGAAFRDPWPVCHATDAAAVHAWLDTLAASRPGRIELGEQARAFAESHLSPEANAQRCIDRLSGA